MRSLKQDHLAKRLSSWDEERCLKVRNETLSGAREVLLQGSFYEVSLALVGVASLAYFQY
jgi:hypothetical protein